MAQEVSFDDDLDGYAIAVSRGENGWRVDDLPDAALDQLSTAVRAIRELRAEGPSFGVLNVDGEYFVLVRPSPAGTRLFISDATMAVMDDLAADVLDELDIPIPEFDEDEWEGVDPYAEGDADLLGDLGLSEDVLQVIVSDDLSADEQIQAIAEALGFGDVFEEAVG